MFVLGVALAGIACRRDQSYSFEASPRPVLAAVGLTATRDPKLAVSSSGTVSLLAVYRDGAMTRLGYTMSHDGGDHFMPVVPVSAPEARVSSHGENSPSLATVPTAIYALWEQESETGSDLMVGRSLSFGHSFEKPTRVNDNQKPSFHGFSNMAVAPNGDVYVVWLDGRDSPATPGTFSVYLARSTDQGATFGKNQRIASAVCPCCRPSITFGPGGEVLVAWRKVYPPDVRDMVVAVSREGGNTFSPEVRVAEDGWRLSGCPDSGPAVAVIGKRFYIAWLTEGKEQKSRIQLSWSDDLAKSFVPPVVASGGVLDPNHPKFAASEDGRLLLVFQGRQSRQNSQAWDPLAAFFTEIQDGNLGELQALGNDGATSVYPAIAAGTGGRAFVAWTSQGEKGSAVVLTRGRR
jgi:hypothetical protein